MTQGAKLLKRYTQERIDTCKFQDKRRAILRFESVNKCFLEKTSMVKAVNDVSLEVYEGEIFGIVGFSGAGKSTLLRMANFLEEPDRGKVFFQGDDLASLSAKDLNKTRQSIGMIFQDFNLFLQRSVVDNVAYPLELAGKSKHLARTKAEYLLELVGLKD